VFIKEDSYLSPAMAKTRQGRSKSTEDITSKDSKKESEPREKLGIDEKKKLLQKAKAESVVKLLPKMTYKNEKKINAVPVDEKRRYWVVDPRLNYRGRNYGEWVCDWFNWFISADADNRNSGPVVHLRSKGPPADESSTETKGRAMASTDEPSTFASDPNYPKKYVNDALIKIGSDRLQIFEDQAVLVPIITAYEIAGGYKDWGYLQDFVGLTIDNGDNPPANEQLTIDDEGIVLPSELELDDFRIVTPIFTAVIPDVEYGRSIKDYLEVPVAPGNYPAMVDGYFVILRFSTGTYVIHSWASAPREATGPYFSELLYEIEVLERPTRARGSITMKHPARNQGLLRKIMHKKEESGEISTGSPVFRVSRFFKQDAYKIGK
jgi:hypothetical protein